MTDKMELTLETCDPNCIKSQPEQDIIPMPDISSGEEPIAVRKSQRNKVQPTRLTYDTPVVARKRKPCKKEHKEDKKDRGNIEDLRNIINKNKGTSGKRQKKEKPNFWAMKQAWLNKMKKLRDDPVYQAQQKIIVESFKRTYVAYKWNDNLSDYENLYRSEFFRCFRSYILYNIPIDHNQIIRSINAIINNAMPIGTTFDTLTVIEYPANSGTKIKHPTVGLSSKSDFDNILGQIYRINPAEFPSGGSLYTSMNTLNSKPFNTLNSAIPFYDGFPSEQDSKEETYKGDLCHSTDTHIEDYKIDIITEKDYEDSLQDLMGRLTLESPLLAPLSGPLIEDIDINLLNKDPSSINNEAERNLLLDTEKHINKYVLSLFPAPPAPPPSQEQFLQKRKEYLEELETIPTDELLTVKSQIDSDFDNRFPDSEVAKFPDSEVRIFPSIKVVGTKRSRPPTADGIKKPSVTRRLRKAVGRLPRPSVKKLVAKAPKVFKSKQPKAQKTKDRKPKSQKGGTRRKKPRKHTRGKRRHRTRAGTHRDRKPPGLSNISLGKYYDEYSQSFREVPGVNTSRKIQSRRNEIMLSTERDQLMRKLARIIEEMPKQSEAQRENSQITLQRLALEVSSLDRKIKNQKASFRKQSGGHCPQCPHTRKN